MDLTKAPPLDPTTGFAPKDGPTPQRGTLSAAAAADAEARFRDDKSQ